tara:strand:- start:471 stop:1013 length:543 start_codon:yes stop_codon:yes gene_type:complete
MIKISNGTKKGFRLKVPNNDLVRPKTSKTRKMIFDILQSVEGMEILDIFAGSGSLGIEALSMGATFATFMDRSTASINCIKDNLSKCDFADKSLIINKDFSSGTRMLIKNKKKYDLIFIDPPYSYFDDKTLNGIIRTALKLSPPGGIIICEHPKEENIVLNVENKVKKYKDKFITFCWQN